MGNQLTPQARAILQARIAQQQAAKGAQPVAIQSTAVASTVPSGLNFDKMMHDYNTLGGNTGFYKFVIGKNVLRFLMNPSDDLFYMTSLETFIPSANPNDRGTYITSPKSGGNVDAYCPVSAMVDKLNHIAQVSVDKQQVAAAQQLAKELRINESWKSNVLVREGNIVSVKLIQYGRQIFKGLVTQLSALVDENDIQGGVLLNHFANDTTGIGVVIIREGMGLSTKYSVVVTAKVWPATPEQLEQRVDLRKLIQPTPDVDTENALCRLFGVGEGLFDSLITPDNLDMKIPVMDGDRKVTGYTSPTVVQPIQHPQPIVTQQQQMPQPVTPQAQVVDTGIPVCIAQYPNAVAGYNCDSCVQKALCIEVTAIQGSADGVEVTLI